MARPPPAGRRRAAGPHRERLARPRAARGSPSPTRRRPPRTSARNTRWSPATAPVCAAAAAPPAADAPALRTATPTPRSAQRASASHSRAPSPSASTNSATERTPRLGRERLEPAGGVHHRLVAGGDHGVQRRAAPQRERVDGEVAALGHERHVAAGARHQRVAPQRGALVQLHDAVAVRAAHRQPVAPRGRPQRLLQRAAAAGLAEARRVHDRPAAAGRARGLDGVRDRGRRDRDDDRVGGLGEIGERRHAGHAEHRLVARVDPVDAPGVAERREVGERLVRVGLLARARAHDRDRSRGGAGG